MNPQKKTQSQIGRSAVRSGKRLENRYANLWSDWTGKTFRRRKVEGRDESIASLEGVSDVICVDAICKFAIESKKEKNFSFMSTPFSHKSVFWDWWRQVSIDAIIRTNNNDKYEFLPLLHFKPTPNHDFVAFEYNKLKRLSLLSPIGGYQIIPNFDKMSEKIEIGKSQVIFEIKTTNILITSWKDFTTSVDPESVFY